MSERTWWKDRLPRDGETAAQAADRLWWTPGYAGSYEDAVIAVADAMAFQRHFHPTSPDVRTHADGGEG